MGNSSSKVVAIIDDDPQDLETMKHAIIAFDPEIRCISFLFPEEALRVISNELKIVPDYVFIDLNMPGKTGFQCLLELRKISHLKKVLIVMYSSKVQTAVKEALSEAGANFVFEKPSHDQWPLLVKKIFNQNN